MPYFVPGTFQIVPTVISVSMAVLSYGFNFGCLIVLLCAVYKKKSIEITKCRWCSYSRLWRLVMWWHHCWFYFLFYSMVCSTTMLINVHSAQVRSGWCCSEHLVQTRQSVINALKGLSWESSASELGSEVHQFLLRYYKVADNCKLTMSRIICASCCVHFSTLNTHIGKAQHESDTILS